LARKCAGTREAPANADAPRVPGHEPATARSSFAEDRLPLGDHAARRAGLSALTGGGHGHVEHERAVQGQVVLVRVNEPFLPRIEKRIEPAAEPFCARRTFTMPPTPAGSRSASACPWY
jgi:hypothetical protein